MVNAGHHSAAENGREHRETLRPTHASPYQQAAREAYSAHEHRLSVLTRTIEGEIIPRLVLSGRVAADAPRNEAGPTMGAAEVATFAQMILDDDEASAVAFVDQQRGRGIDVRTLFLDLLAPAARMLGEMWESDHLSFADVTIGLGRLQRVLHELARALRTDALTADPDRRILLVPAPGEQHTFGLAMLAEFFRDAKWDVAHERPAARSDLARLVKREWFAVIGFSVACDGSIETLAVEIVAVRRASLNKSIRVMVGGPAFLKHPELVARVGADATAVDGRQAVVQAQDLLALLPRRV